MADTGFNYAGTVSQLTFSGASYNWTNATNAQGSPNSGYATGSTSEATSTYSAKLVVSGSVSGDENRFDANLPWSAGSATFGGAADLWGVSLTPDIVNASDFGFVFSVGQTYDYTHYLKCVGYNFSIPSGSTIDGVQVVVTGYRAESRGSGTGYVDAVGIKVYYTEGGGGFNVAWARNANSVLKVM